MFLISQQTTPSATYAISLRKGLPGGLTKESGKGMSCSCAPSAHDEMCLVIEMLLEGRRLKRCHSTFWAHCELTVIDQPGRSTVKMLHF
ncbi:hypothetical protein NPIL_639511 [Nephila pilipes]|uniref:Uncharacterized protein n=1 Tax=Nephila pilipes TaxID=299642 RepID=A0A8X6PW74_NEPPI|nr:hypothetical protein NPIL_639511 [Nephila pilipes]